MTPCEAAQAAEAQAKSHSDAANAALSRAQTARTAAQPAVGAAATALAVAMGQRSHPELTDPTEKVAGWMVLAGDNYCERHPS